MHPRQRLDGEHPFRGNTLPCGNRRLRNADRPRQRRDPTRSFDGLFQTGVTHDATAFSPNVPLNRAYNSELELFQCEICNIGNSYVPKTFV